MPYNTSESRTTPASSCCGVNEAGRLSRRRIRAVLVINLLGPRSCERKPISRDKSALKYRKVFCDSLHYPGGTGPTSLRLPLLRWVRRAGESK